MKIKNRIVSINGVRTKSRGCKKLAAASLSFALAASFLSSPVAASPIGAGWISTDRLGYNGTITRYNDAGLSEQVGDVIQTGPRDLSLYGVSNVASSTDAAIAVGAWWYSTAMDGDGNPRGLGWGNTTGNTGPGFMQYYGLPATYDQVTETSYGFGGFDGTYWTEFSYLLEVLNGDAAARLSAPSNTDDQGIFRSLTVDLTVSGLEGELGGDWISASNQPTGVTGSIRGLFENTSETSANNGFYEFDFSLNMQNWAWDNRDDLVGDYQFANSSFGAQVNAVPVPGSLVLIGLGLVGFGFMRRRRVR